MRALYERLRIPLPNGNQPVRDDESILSLEIINRIISSSEEVFKSLIQNSGPIEGAKILMEAMNLNITEELLRSEEARKIMRALAQPNTMLFFPGDENQNPWARTLLSLVFLDKLQRHCNDNPDIRELDWASQWIQHRCNMIKQKMEFSKPVDYSKTKSAIVTSFAIFFGYFYLLPEKDEYLKLLKIFSLMFSMLVVTTFVGDNIGHKIDSHFKRESDKKNYGVLYEKIFEYLSSIERQKVSTPAATADEGPYKEFVGAIYERRRF